MRLDQWRGGIEGCTHRRHLPPSNATTGYIAAASLPLYQRRCRPAQLMSLWPGEPLFLEGQEVLLFSSQLHAKTFHILPAGNKRGLFAGQC